MGFGDSDGSLRNWLWLGGAGFSWNFPTLVLGGEASVVMGVPNMVVGEDRHRFSWQSQTLIVCGRSVGSHGSLRCLLGGQVVISFQSQMMVAGGRHLALMAVPDAGCGQEGRAFSWQ